jgi:hypothetical protein
MLTESQKLISQNRKMYPFSDLPAMELSQSLSPSLVRRCPDSAVIRLACLEAEWEEGLEEGEGRDEESEKRVRIPVDSR